MSLKLVQIDVPNEDRGVLVRPALAELPALVEANAKSLAACDAPFAGRTLAEGRDAGRDEILSAAHAYTASLDVPAHAWSGEAVVLTGHQPEFYHPGVWIKNHLCGRLADAVGGVGLNLVVDNDVPREGELTFPVHRHGAFTQHGVHFAAVDSARAWEEHTDKTSWQFDHLAGEVADLLPVDARPLVIERMMKHVTAAMREAADVAHLMTLLRRRYEEKIGLANLEIPASVMCGTRAWARFVLALAADAVRFADIYNAAVADYRRVNGVRSASHPVPDLAAGDEGRVELPFWAWRPGAERGRLHVSPDDGTLLIDRTPVMTFDAVTWRALAAGDADAFDDAAGRMLAEGKDAFKVRPRALSNTIFCRMLLADVFIHGVGGAKYDTITDEIIRNWMGVEPPGFITSSATLYLPIDVESARRSDVRRLRRDLRDCTFNADRHMSPDLRQSQRAEELVTEKRRLISENRRLRDSADDRSKLELRAKRRDLFDRIRRHNAEMTQLIDDRIAEMKRGIARIEQHVGDREVVLQRGYAFVLYPEQMLLGFYHEALRR